MDTSQDLRLSRSRFKIPFAQPKGSFGLCFRVASSPDAGCDVGRIDEFD
jgi:hypothetical protein